MFRRIVRKANQAGLDSTQVLRTALSKAGIDKSYAKIFAIGFNKTATTSIHKLFGELGYTARYHNTHWRSASAHWSHWRGQAFSDGPPEDFKKLDRNFPRSKFILNTRDPLEWIDSRCEHIKVMHSKGYVSNSSTWQVSQKAVEYWIHERNAHHLEIMEYFSDRPQDLLIVNFIRDPEAARKIAKFLKVEGTWQKPHSHTIKTARLPGSIKNSEMIEAALRKMGIDESEWCYDLYFPSLNPSATYQFDTSLLVPRQGFRTVR